MSLKKYKEDFLLFAEGGFIAVNQADEDAAIKLFKAAALLDSKNVLPPIGFGYLHLHKMELKEAAEHFEKALKLEPDNEMAKALLGFTMSLSPELGSKGEKMLASIEKSKDTEIKKMAHLALDFVDRFVKPPPGPAGKHR
jgi:tetratricopeptide (TPR) repeat protein